MAWTRRDLLRAAGALVAVTAVGDARAEGRVRLPCKALPIQALQAGMPLGPCTFMREVVVGHGALWFELADPKGQVFVVEAHRRDAGSPPGIARAGSLEVYLCNSGTGATPTDETHGLGAMALASVLAARERAGEPVPKLASILERWRLDPPPRLSAGPRG